MLKKILILILLITLINASHAKDRMQDSIIEKPEIITFIAKNPKYSICKLIDLAKLANLPNSVVLGLLTLSIILNTTKTD